VVGAVLPDLERFGLGFAFTAAFIAMARGLWRGQSQMLPWIVAAVATVAVVSLGLPKAYAIVAGTVCCLVVLAARRRIERADA
jgi:predicted branched-subunit amino acid permease